jgi:pyruvate formate lyase activating enzyme
MTVSEVLEEVEKDRMFYDSSGGGVTLSGGEVLAQWRFALELLRELGRRDLHTAVETSGCGPWEHVGPVAEACDLVLYDLKHMDDAEHRRHTGVSNTLILENARRLAQTNVRLVFRIPLIGGINTDRENIEASAAFALETGVREVHLLPFHRLGESKYARLHREYQCEGYTPEDRTIEGIRKQLESHGLRVKVGGG